MFHSLLIGFLALILLGCRALEYENIEYQDEKDTGSSGGAADCLVGEKAYQAFVKDILEGTCINCHVEGGIAQDQFVILANNDATNRTTFLNLLDGQVESIVKKTNGTDSHGGGTVINSDEATLIRTYFDIEKRCL